MFQRIRGLEVGFVTRERNGTERANLAVIAHELKRFGFAALRQQLRENRMFLR